MIIQTFKKWSKWEFFYGPEFTKNSDNSTLCCALMIYKEFFFTISLLFFVGFPQVEYRWMKDGVFLSDFSSEHFYKIQSVSRTDAGDYRCYAKNSVGTIISEKIRLTVACKLHFYFKLLK